MTYFSGSKFFGCFEKHPKVVSRALRDGFWAREVFWSFEKRTPGLSTSCHRGRVGGVKVNRRLWFGFEHRRIRGRGRGGRGPPFFLVFSKCFWNVNFTLLCITNTPTMLYAACPEKWSFHSGVGDSAPSFWIFWIRPCHATIFSRCCYVFEKKKAKAIELPFWLHRNWILQAMYFCKVIAIFSRHLYFLFQ